MRHTTTRLSLALVNEETGVERRLRLPLWPAAAVLAALVVLPLLVGVGAYLAAQDDISRLTATSIALRMENDNSREATGQLATQILTLQGAVDDIGARAAVDPEASRAMDRLPAVVRSRAMGGSSGGALTPILTGTFGAPDSAFGVIRDLLGAIEERLNTVRTGVERRQELAAATPSIWPVTGWLSSSFGSRRDPFTGGDDYHPGLDIAASAGQSVLAPADGTVTTAAPSGSYGNLVVVDHGFGIVTRYGHLSRFGVRAGDRVTRGQVIGYVGSTGRSTSPHLHYEIWINGRLTNPLRLLARH
jgi:murein DD-endopeptidase MepM/ murein hydrolase activator NlpD